MDKWRLRVRKRDGLSLESREGRDGDDLARGGLGQTGMLEVRDLLFLIHHELALYTLLPFSQCLTSRNR